MKRLRLVKFPWMSRADRRRWAAAHTVGDLGKLMAQWLEGSIASWPGYAPNYGPEPETHPLIPVLAAANRSGYLTSNSQPGGTGPGWEQRAAVTGFVADADLLGRLKERADAAGLITVWHRTARPLPGERTFTMVITTVDGEPFTAYGNRIDLGGELETMWPAHLVSREAFDQLTRAWQITIIDPEWGREDRLWDALAAALAGPVPDPPAAAPTVLCTVCGCTAIDGQVCGDGCSGVTDQHVGRCEACIDPSVIIDWSTVHDDESECVLCGAPHYSREAYCSITCELADSDSEGEWDPGIRVSPRKTMSGHPDEPPF